MRKLDYIAIMNTNIDIKEQVILLKDVPSCRYHLAGCLPVDVPSVTSSHEAQIPKEWVILRKDMSLMTNYDT